MDLKENKWIFTHSEIILDMWTKWIAQWKCQQMQWKIWCVIKRCMGMMITHDVLKQNQTWDIMMDTTWLRMSISQLCSINSVNLNQCTKGKLIQIFSRRIDYQNQRIDYQNLPYKKFKTRKCLLWKLKTSLQLWQALLWKRK